MMDNHAEGLLQDDLETAQDRYENYRILSRLFRQEIDLDLLRDLRCGLEEESIGNALFDEGLQQLVSYLSSSADDNNMKSQLAIDYCLTFVGYGVDPDSKDAEKKMHVAYPYESIYTTGDKTLTSGLAEGVSLIYREQGFHPSKPRILADDHMACELEFLQFIVGQQVLALREEDRELAASFIPIQINFIEKHPLTWIESFSEAIQHRSETSFYPALAQMTEGWLQEDLSYLKGETRG